MIKKLSYTILMMLFTVVLNTSANANLVVSSDGVAAKSTTTGFRYMTQGELNAIRSGSGKGFLRGARPGETYFSKDLYKSGLKAQQRLALPTKPTLRVEFEILNNPSYLRYGTKVKPAYGMPGKGAEFMTKNPVRVRLINWQPIH